MRDQLLTGSNTTPRVPRPARPTFVGRGPQLATLTQALADRPSVVLVEGEAGIGKSRLLREFLASPAGQRLRTLVAVCPPFRQPYTLGPVVDAVRQAADNVTGLGLSGLAGALRPLFPEWADFLPPMPEPLEDATASRHRLFRAFTELLSCLGTAVLAVEDVHWADEATLEFLLFVTSREPQPVSVVVTYRPEDVPEDSLLLRLSSRLPTDTTQSRITVRALDVAAMADMVSSMLAGGHVSADFAAFLHQRTDGVPLAVEETVRLMLDRADVAPHGQGWIRRHLEDIAVPPTVRDAVLERVRRLRAPAQVVLRTAAVLADPTEETVLYAVTGLPVDSASDGLAETVESGLVHEDERGLLSFRHVLAGRAVYEAMPASERRAIHLRAGRALEGTAPSQVSRLARHFRAAGALVEWCRYAEQAADLASAAGDEGAAATALHGLLTSAELPARDVVRLMDKITFASLAGPGRLEELAGALREALARPGTDHAEETELRFHLGRILMATGQYEAARSELEQAVRHLADPAQAARAMMLLGWPLGNARPSASRRRWLRRAGELAASMSPVDRLRFLVDRASVLVNSGEQEGWAIAAEVPDHGATPTERSQLARGQLNLGSSAIVWGRYAEARLRLTIALELAERHNYLRVHHLVLVNLLMLDWATGSWTGLADRADALIRNEDIHRLTRVEAIQIAGKLCAAQGDTVLAREHLQRALAEYREYGAIENSVEPVAELARLRLAEGGVDDAVAMTGDAIGMVAPLENWVIATDLVPVRVRALVGAGLDSQASELVAVFARGLRGREAPAGRAALALCRATLTTTRGEPARSARLFGQVAAIWRELPRPYDALIAQEQQANLLLSAGDRGLGLPLLIEVHRGLSELGARGDGDRVLGVIAEHGGQTQPRRRGPGRLGYGRHLSPRELDVIRLLARGWTNQQVAQTLVVSRQTVASHVRSAMRKLRVSSRTALAVRAVEMGLVQVDESFSPADE